MMPRLTGAALSTVAVLGVFLFGASVPVASSSPPPSGVVRMMVAGDVMLDRSLRDVVRRDTERPFRDVSTILDEADLALINLECVISDRGTPDDKTFTFRAPLEAADALASGSIDLVSVANNHSLDFGWVALRQTRALLRDRGIATFGAGRDASHAHAPRIVERNGLTIAFLGYLDLIPGSDRWHPAEWEATEDAPGIALSRSGQVARDVEAAADVADVVVAMFHFGVERSAVVSDRQRRLARVALEAGASLVLGAHPHILQPVQADDPRFIAYSLGNFVFDRFTGRFDDSVILDVELSAAGVGTVRYHPVVLDPSFPRPATPEESERILRRLAPVP